MMSVPDPGRGAAGRSGRRRADRGRRASPASAASPPASADAEVIEADGLVLLPGLVDLHTHLREPGREDAETIETGSAAAALGGFTAVHAMANTTPVADNAEIVETVLRAGERAGLVDVRPVGAVSKGLAGTELAELAGMARSAAAVRVFSDDGHCVHDARLMRRALEYAKAFDAVIAQHAQDPRLADAQACAHEGELSGRLGLPGWPAVAEESIIARDVMLAEHTGSRLHVCHVSTGGSVEVLRWAKAPGHRRHRRGHAAPPAADHRPAGRLRPRLQGQPAAAAGRRRDRAARGAGRRHHRRRRHRPRPARPARQGARLRRRRLRHARAADRARRGGRGHGRRPGGSTGPASPTAWRCGRRASPGSAGHGRPHRGGGAGQPHPRRPGRERHGRPGGAGVQVAQHAVRRADPAGGGGRDVPARPAHRARRRRTRRSTV